MASFLRLSTLPKTNLFPTFLLLFFPHKLYITLFSFFFSLAFFNPHTFYVICPVPVISTLPTFEFQHIFIFTFMSLSQYHFSSSSISSSVPIPLLQFSLSNFSPWIFFFFFFLFSYIGTTFVYFFSFHFSFLRFIGVQNADLLSF